LPQLDSERKDLSAYIISTSCIVIGQAATWIRQTKISPHLDCERKNLYAHTTNIWCSNLDRQNLEHLQIQWIILL
jgi:hypothetical protein